ncbi:MAG: SoxR reducing system RseC family protein [Spirochaetaceae bacterium]|jgi:positive regulator of sigma E activity|nr:SoxR reducing system RseC family protein [Spirochaetaceae bacterium]
MTETGRVQEVSGNRVTVKRDSVEACFGCMNRACRIGGGIIIVEYKDRPLPEPGELVKVEFSSGAALGEGLLTIILPIAGCIAGFFLSGLAFPSLGDPPRAFIGLFALFGIAAALYFIRRRFPPKTLHRIAAVKRIVSSIN